MSSPEAPTMSVTFRGIFFIILGAALLLNTIAPSQYIKYLVSIAIVTGALLMIVYGSVLLKLHVYLGRLIASWSDGHRSER